MKLPLLDAFAKLRKISMSFVMFVRPSAWNNSALTGWIFMKVDIFAFYIYIYIYFKIQVSLKSDKNDWYFT